MGGTSYALSSESTKTSRNKKVGLIDLKDVIHHHLTKTMYLLFLQKPTTDISEHHHHGQYFDIAQQ